MFFGARGFTAISRVHFAIGVLGFLMSPIWLAMILVGLALTANVILSRPEYFPNSYQLFPDWPTFDAARMTWLFVAAMDGMELQWLIDPRVDLLELFDRFLETTLARWAR